MLARKAVCANRGLLGWAWEDAILFACFGVGSDGLAVRATPIIDFPLMRVASSPVYGSDWSCE